MTKRRDLVRQLENSGFWSNGGTNHEHFTNGKITVMVKRHREIPDELQRGFYVRRASDNRVHQQFRRTP